MRDILHHEEADTYFAGADALLERTGLASWFGTDVPSWPLARAIWNATPLPSNGFQPRPLPVPGRNDPCPCGSGKKFKRCCRGVPTDDFDVGARQIMACAVSQFTEQQREVALQEAPVVVRLLVGDDELERNHPDKARDIALDILENPPRNAADHALVIALLGNAHDALGDERTGERKMHDLADQLSGLPAAAALQWLAARQLDQQQPHAALELVVRASAEAPDDVTNGMLLVVTLRAMGEDEGAREAATEWLELAEECGDHVSAEWFHEQLEALL
ncbi:SEC-C domain-containing protein [Halomonas sp. EGI 63088]|uniref:SEC-C domain-containing protein n=1 Tax=Halomonas flagellata TaxID=2920385 RepID=A0ABS9S0I2_9GAMM|nr:SEC-C metal-binding domain-containing protein [Halomonas flagellata]MCH4565515.1 SEC-C domain-containing protein [Halomonas flagellata]